MGYRSLKRVLGETSLERKCRLLFGICLSILIAGAFWFVEYNAEQMVMQTTRRKARDLVDLTFIKYHIKSWSTPDADSQQDRERELARLMTEGLDQSEYSFEVLAFESRRRAVQPTNPQQLERLQVLQAEMQQQLEQLAATGELGTGAVAPPESAPIYEALGKAAEQPVYEELILADLGEYHYFQPVYWEYTCTYCHFEAPGAFRAVKVILPYDDVQESLNTARAILIAVGILTVFLSMIGLYGIVRYVIVKPLKHLRDVSDEISRGNTDLRADIHTADEFEELAASFNRMLRHLTDAQIELRQVNTDLDAKVDQLAQLNMRLYEMNRLKSDFLANMSHELRTPLNSIIGFSEVLQGISSLTDKQKRYAQNIQKSGRLLLEMINDILDLAKMESGKMELRPTEFRVETIVNAQCDMVRSLTEEKNIDLETRVPPDLPPLYQDQSKVQQILTNLLSNAIKFTPEGGRITVTAGRGEQDKLELVVTDTGVGIAEEDREIIFEKFRQSSAVLGQDGLTREYSGTGLGLSIVKELCKLLGGEVTFESDVGKGSSFKIVLPWVITRPKRIDRELSRLEEFARLNQDQLEPAATSPLDSSASVESSRVEH